MKYFIKNRKHLIKFLEIALIFAFLFVGSYAYEKNKFVIANFESYQLPDYKYLIQSMVKKDRIEEVIINEEIKGVPVVVYYGVLPDEEFEKLDEKQKLVYISLSRFREQMHALKDAGWNAISLGEFQSFLSGETDLNKKSFLLTFNNARRDNFYLVDPIINALNYSAVMFVITENSFYQENKQYGFYLKEDELKYMLKTGRWSIESYGRYNPEQVVVNYKGEKASPLGNKLWIDSEKRFETDDEFFSRSVDNVLRSKAIIENNLGIKVTGFSFPFGYVGLDSKNYPQAQDVILNLSKSIYALSFYDVSYFKSDILNYPNNGGLVKRMIGDDSFSGNQLVQIFEASKVKPLPFEDSFESDNEWKKRFGEFNIKDGVLNVKSFANSTGSYFSLDGAALWKNYFYEMDVVKKKDKSQIVLIGYMDDKKSYSCVISDEYMEMQKTSKKGVKILAKYKLVEKMNTASSIRVGLGRNSDNELSCRVGNYFYVAPGTFIDKDISGQVMVKLLSSDLGGVDVDIDNFAVKEGIIENNEIARVGEEFLQTVVLLKKEADKIDYPELSVPYHWTKDSKEEWERKWGDVVLDQSGLSVASFIDSTSAFALLHGADLFQDKTNLIFDLDWQGSNAVLAYRYQDENNYGMVNIHNDYMRIIEVVDGKTKTIEEVRRDMSKSEKKGFYKRFLNVKLTLDGKNINVWLDGKMIVSSKGQSKLLSSGSVGIKGWSKNFGESRIILKSLKVEAR